MEIGDRRREGRVGHGGRDTRGGLSTRSGRGRAVVGAVLAAGALVVAGCSTSAGAPEAASPAASNVRTDGTTPGWSPPACDRPAAAPPVAVPVDGVASDHTVTSFDGTELRVHWFPLATGEPPAPTVLMGPGWGLPGDTNEDAVGVLGALNIKALRDAGFNVLTWDPRGFGRSTGTAEVDSKDFEGRDVQVLLDWVAAQPGVQVDRAGDPRVGMIGGSYGGGIQLVTAAIDCRVDAIVPVIAWHSLETSLDKSETPKTGWSNILIAVSKTASVDQHAIDASADANATGVIDPAEVQWFRDRGPGDLVGTIRVPTLIVQGTVDTLFTLDEGIANYRILRDNGVPVSMMWFCGGHGTCLTDAGDTDRVSTASIAWLKRWVQRDTTAPEGRRVDVIDQHGASYQADDYPLPAGAPITATGTGTLALASGGGAGPLTDLPPDKPDLLRSLVVPVTPARATNAVDVTIATPAAALVVGAPELTVRYSGTADPGERPTRVFAQLVDDETGRVLGNQITPVAVALDGQPHELTVPLESVAFATAVGGSITLQLVATTVAYAQPRLGGSVTFDRIEVRLPTAASITPTAG